MSTQARSTPGPVVALAAALVVGLALAPSLVAAPGLAQSDNAPDDQGAQTQPANGSDEERAQGQDRGGQDERRGPDDRGRADPVEIRDKGPGFATTAPPDSPRPSFAMDARNASAVVERPDVVPLNLRLDTLVEFADRDGDGAYDVGEPVERRISLREAPREIQVDEANATRTVVYEVANGSHLELAFDFGTGHGSQVATKLDVVVEDYPFQAPHHRIALGSQVQVDGGLERVTHDGRPALAGEAGDEVAYLSWTEDVRVDGEARQVASTVHISADEPTETAVVYWAYPQGETIVHDPTFGVQEAVEDLAGRLSAFGFGLAATVTLLGLGFAARERWRI